MSDLHLSCSLNHDRPKIQHSDVTDESIFTWICMFATIGTVLKCYCHSRDTPLFKTKGIAEMSIHRLLLSTSRVLIINRPYGPRLSYTNIGISQQTSRVNVIISNGKLMPSFVTVSM